MRKKYLITPKCILGSIHNLKTMPERDHMQCDSTMLHTKNGIGGVSLIYGKETELESVTPSKVSNFMSTLYFVLLVAIKS